MILEILIFFAIGRSFMMIRFAAVLLLIVPFSDTSYAATSLPLAMKDGVALEATYFAIATKRIASVIHVADQTCFVHELEQIRTALSNGAALDPYSFLTKGRRVRVTSGPFRGIEGLVEDRPEPERLILQIDALGQATSLEIDAALLESAE